MSYTAQDPIFGPNVVIMVNDPAGNGHGLKAFAESLGWPQMKADTTPAMLASLETLAFWNSNERHDRVSFYVYRVNNAIITNDEGQIMTVLVLVFRGDKTEYTYLTTDAELEAELAGILLDAANEEAIPYYSRSVTELYELSDLVLKARWNMEELEYLIAQEQRELWDVL